MHFKIQNNDVTGSTDLVSTTKEVPPTPSADEVIAHVESAEKTDSTTGNLHALQALSGDNKTVDLTTKKESDSNSSESTQENKIISFGSGNTSDLSFADLASRNSGDFAFGSKGKIESGAEAQEFYNQGLIPVQQHQTKINQMRETLRTVTEESSRLKSSLNSLRKENEFLKKQLNDANELKTMIENRARRVQAELEDLQNREFLMAQKSKDSEEVVHKSKPVKEEKERGASKSVKSLPNTEVYNLLTILMDWISDEHLSKTGIQENYTLVNCKKLLPMVTGQLQWMPFVDPNLHMPVIQFIYWSLRQLDTGINVNSQEHESMISTMERLGELCFKGVIDKGNLQKQSKRSKPKRALFFRSPFMPLRFLSTLIVLVTAKRVNYLTQAFQSLCVDLKTDEGKTLFLQYECVPVMLSHLNISRKRLLSGALDALVEMAMNSKKSCLRLFLECCSTESFFHACSALLQNPKADIWILEKICFVLRKLSEIKSNKKMFEFFSLPYVFQELLKIVHPEHCYLCMDLKALLFNLQVAKRDTAGL